MLKLGTAYHGNRMLHHAKADMEEIAACGMNLVVHMLTHTDMDRNKAVMKEIIQASHDAGLEVWVDNWGLAGAPGEKSYFLGDHPDSHRCWSDGTMVPYMVCWNSPDFLDFTKRWIDAVVEIGGTTIIWDEPHLGTKEENGKKLFSCGCPRCRKLFEERYGHPMPEEESEETVAFAKESIVSYLTAVTDYSHSKGLKNVVCVMPDSSGASLQTADRLCAIPHMDNVGTDPYFVHLKKPGFSVYEYVYTHSVECLETCKKHGKDHNIWIQTYRNHAGLEEDIVEAYEAAYDAGARTILNWGWYGSDGVDYRAINPLQTQIKIREAVARIRNMERDRILEENRKKYKK